MIIKDLNLPVVPKLLSYDSHCLSLICNKIRVWRGGSAQACHATGSDSIPGSDLVQIFSVMNIGKNFTIDQLMFAVMMVAQYDAIKELF